MGFEKRDIILLAGIILLILGLSPFIAPAYSVIIGIGIFFGIKAIVIKRKKSMKNQFGEGFCAQCGERIINRKCPNCDNLSKKEA